jgi:hypothetical protein
VTRHGTRKDVAFDRLGDISGMRLSVMRPSVEVIEQRQDYQDQSVVVCGGDDAKNGRKW